MLKTHERFFARALMQVCIVGLLLIACTTQAARAQSIENDRKRAVQMLNVIKEDIRKYYYDAAFRGIDLDAHFKSAEEKIGRAASIGEALSIIAKTLMMFDDSHTFFLVPPPAQRVEQGWELQMVGNKCYVVAVKPGSDAAKKGLQPGDEILLLAGNKPARENLWQLMYFLRYQPFIPVLIKRGSAEQQSLDIMAKVEGERPVRHVGILTAIDRPEIIREWEMEVRLRRHRFYETDETFIWRMPAFDKKEGDIDEVMNKARKRKSMILDLRGNPGGMQKTLLRLVGNLFEHDVKIGDDKWRDKTQPLIAKTVGAKRAFNGKLVVIVDSQSGSAAEMLARVVQLEKRGIVIGDRTGGDVMGATHLRHEATGGYKFYYGASITIFDVIMTDGKSLERTGVTPDELIIPTPEAMAAQLDPVLTRAGELVGFTLDPQKAGKLFPVEWRP